MDIQYTRNDVDFETWYSAWMKQLAKSYTVEELESKLYGAKSEAARSSKNHLRAIQRTHSMSSNSQARAHARNVTAAAGDYAIALRGAIEIHQLFPEHAKTPNKACTRRAKVVAQKVSSKSKGSAKPTRG